MNKTEGFAYINSLELLCLFITVSVSHEWSVLSFSITHRNLRGIEKIVWVHRKRIKLRVEGVAVSWPRSESFGRHNLFYAFNLGGLVTYILSSHLFSWRPAFYGWTLLSSFTSCLFILLQTVGVFPLHSLKTKPNKAQNSEYLNWIRLFSECRYKQIPNKYKQMSLF